MADKDVLGLTLLAPVDTGVVEWQTAAGGAASSKRTSWTLAKTYMSNAPTLVGPILGIPASGSLTNCTGLPLSTGVTGNLPVANLNGGSGASATTFWSGDSSWKVPIALTTTGTSGAATFIAGILNIPQYTGGGGGNVSAAATLTVDMPVLGDGTTAVKAGLINLATMTSGSPPANETPVTTTTYTILTTDAGKIVKFTNAAGCAVTLPQAGTTGFLAGFAYVSLAAPGAGTVTTTPTTSTIAGTTTLVQTAGQSCGVVVDSVATNYDTTPGMGGSGGSTTLTGDVTGTGTGSVATTLATVNSNVGSFSNANITVNAKGLVTAASNGSGGGGSSGFQHPQGRLTLTTGVPVTTSDVTTSSHVYYTPYLGNGITLWNGSAWTTIAFTEQDFTLTGLVSDRPYDVFAFLNAGALNIEVLAWTNGTTRATAVTLQDAYCKSGDKTRLYLGTFYTISTSATADSGGGTTTQVGGQRFLWNMYNRVRRQLTVIDTTGTWTYASGQPYRQANGASGNKVEIVVGIPEDAVEAQLMALYDIATTGDSMSPGIGVNSTTVNSAQLAEFNYTVASVTLAVKGARCSYNGIPAAGYSALNWLENTVSCGNTLTFEGNGGGTTAGGRQSSLQATFWA